MPPGNASSQSIRGYSKLEQVRKVSNQNLAIEAKHIVDSRRRATPSRPMPSIKERVLVVFPIRVNQPHRMTQACHVLDDRRSRIGCSSLCYVIGNERGSWYVVNSVVLCVLKTVFPSAWFGHQLYREVRLRTTRRTSRDMIVESRSRSLL